MDLNNIKVAVIGLGYVGLPLAVEFGKKRDVVGFDVNHQRLSELASNIDSTQETTEKELKEAKYLSFTDDINKIKKCNCYIITVPTPVDINKLPGLSIIKQASESVGNVLKKGDIVIYESTVYPGTTEEVCVPLLEKNSSLKFNKDFFCGYSPERINPGDKEHRLTNIIKITSGSTPESAQIIDDLYNEIVKAGTHKAESIKVAEASKAIENAQRDLNISFVNELAMIFDKMDIDTTEVLDAASTKWNFLNFKPGLVGGHCISVDPYYLTYKAKEVGYSPDVILSGRLVNENMADFVAGKLLKTMEKNDIQVRGSKILILGITYKENCPDTRNTKIPEVYNKLIDQGSEVSIYDPYASFEEVKSDYNINLVSELNNYDGIILAVSHSIFKTLNYNKLKKESNSVILDVKSFLEQKIVDARL